MEKMETNFLSASEPRPQVMVARAVVGGSASEESIYLSVVRWVVGITVFLIPLFFLPWGTNLLELNKQLLLVIAAGVGLVVWLLGVVVTGRMIIRVTPLDWGVGALVAGTLLTTIFSVSPLRSLYGVQGATSESLVSVLALSILYFLAAHSFHDKGRVLIRVLGVSALVALVFGLMQMLTWYVLGAGFAHSRVFNTVGSVNSLGVLAALMLPLFLKVKFVWNKIPKVNFAYLGVAVAAAVLVSLNWWVLWAVAGVGLLALVAADSVASMHEPRSVRIGRFLAPLSIIVIGAFLLLVKFSFQPIRSNLPVEVSPTYRLSLNVAGSVLKESLITGYGPENFSYAFDRYGAGRLSNTTLSNLRFTDSIAQVFNWATGGIVMIIATIMFIVAIVQFFRTYIARQQGGTAIQAVACAMGAAGLVGLFLYPFNLTLFTVLFSTLAITVLAFASDRKRVVSIEDSPVVSLSSSVGFIVGLILVLAGSYFVVIRYTADTVYAQGLKLPATEAAPIFVQAINWNNRDDRFYRSLSQTTLGLLSAEVEKTADDSDTGRNSRIQNYIASAVSFGQRATEINPRESANWFNLGNVYESLFGYADRADQLAEEAYNKAAELRPGDASIAYRVGSMYLAYADSAVRLAGRTSGAQAQGFRNQAKGFLEKSEGYLKRSTEEAPNFGLAVYTLGAVYERQGKLVQAISLLEKVLPANANQPGLFFELGLLYYRNGQKDNGFSALKQAVVLSPEYANARWYLALMYEERKDIPSAIAELEKILENNAGNETVISTIDRLKAGQIVIPPAKVIDQKPLDR